jgi:glycosyltransferase involved in cell wall biosynthesis
MLSPSGRAKVAILLCTRNGESFLQPQLDSYAAQTHGEWTCYASDDGSRDRTREILARQRLAWGQGRLVIVDGPGQGGSANFMFLVGRDDIEADYFAFSDQDDIWEAEKLARALSWLGTVPGEVPALYCGRTRNIDAQGDEIGLSPVNQRPPCFANALVQNIAGGNTMVFNQAARRLIKALGPGIPVVLHDWWTYQVVSGCGGEVFFDSEPYVRYRQHPGNLIGANAGWWSRWRRAGESLRGLHRVWYDTQLAALAVVEPELTFDNVRLCGRFRRARQQWLLPRMFGIWRSGVYRQTRAQRWWFLAQVLLDRV